MAFTTSRNSPSIKNSHKLPPPTPHPLAEGAQMIHSEVILQRIRTFIHSTNSKVPKDTGVGGSNVLSMPAEDCINVQNVTLILCFHIQQHPGYYLNKLMYESVTVNTRHHNKHLMQVWSPWVYKQCFTWHTNATRAVSRVKPLCTKLRTLTHQAHLQ